MVTLKEKKTLDEYGERRCLPFSSLFWVTPEAVSEKEENRLADWQLLDCLTACSCPGWKKKRVRENNNGGAAIRNKGGEWGPLRH